jgi:hypothetical protein
MMEGFCFAITLSRLHLDLVGAEPSFISTHHSRYMAVDIYFMGGNMLAGPSDMTLQSTKSCFSRPFIIGGIGSHFC